MSAASVNVHATAIVVGTTGLLFVGASGSGKSSMAFACLQSARNKGLFAALIADDQVFLKQMGQHLLAEQPASISGLIELRGTSIAAIAHCSAAILTYAIQPVALATSPRLPPENETYPTPGGGALPLLRIAISAPDPLAILSAFIPTLLSN